MPGRLGGIAHHLVDHIGLGDPLVGQGDGQSLVQERHLLQATRDRLEVVDGGLEDVRIRPEPDGGTGALGGVTLEELARLGILVFLGPVEAVHVDVRLEAGRQRVHHRDADAVQTTGHRVGIGVELAARVQLGHDHLDGRHPLRVHRDRNTAAVVHDLDTAIGQQRDVDTRGVTRHRLVDRVVDDLPDQVVQTSLARGADVHTGPFTNRLEALENGDGGSTVFA